MFPLAIAMLVVVVLMLACTAACISELAISYDPWRNRLRGAPLFSAALWATAALVFAIVGIQIAIALRPHVG